jgi:hypothetical protein
MRHQALSRACALCACIVGFAGATSSLARSSVYPQAANVFRSYSAFVLMPAQQDKSQGPKLSDDERKAAKKISDAKGLDAQLQASAEFVKKYPKSAARPQIAKYLAEQIKGIQDRAQKISTAQTYLEFFNETAEVDAVEPLLIEAYLDNSKPDEAFRAAAPWLVKHPDDLELLARLTLAGSNEALRGNSNFLKLSQQYGTQAIEMMEADKRPAGIEAAQWTEYKTRMLPALDREVGVIALRLDDKATAKVRLEKAATLKTTDPSVYAVLGGFADEDYEALVDKYKSAKPAERDAALKKAQEQLDRVIELYAQAVALSEAKPEYKQITDQLMPSLQSYYKFRHNGSTDGLQQLLDKYRKSPATP